MAAASSEVSVGTAPRHGVDADEGHIRMKIADEVLPWLPDEGQRPWAHRAAEYDDSHFG